MSALLHGHQRKLCQQNTELRNALSLLEGERIVWHADAIERLRGVYDHDITYVDVAHGSRCAAFALGVSADPVFQQLNKNWNIQLDRIFWSWLVDTKLRLAEPMSEGSLILYLRGGVWTHSGRVIGGKVLSKWGTFPVYIHPVEQVPILYGSEILFCEMPSRMSVRQWLLEYGHRHGAPVATGGTLRSARNLENRV